MNRKEAIEVLRKYSPKDAELREALETAVPELKESEDEIIRNKIIGYLKQDIEEHPERKERIEDMLAWLEKQDSHYTFEIKMGHWYKCVCDYMLNGSDLIFKNNRLYYCRRDWRLGGEIDERNVKAIGVNGYKSFFRPATNQEIKDWLEKQSEQNLANSAKTCKVEPKFKVKYAGGEYDVFETKELAGITFYGIEDEPNHIDYVKAESCEIIGGYTIKENGSPYPTNPAVFSEQKPADKVEPKFKVGDFVIHRDYSNIIYRVQKSWGDNTYAICPYFDTGKVFTAVHENSIHLWTINDAKSGDILYSDRVHGTIIFKGWSSDNKHIIAYCALQQGIFIDQEMQWDTDFEPAIEPRYDEFFSAMSNSGYKWEAEKKELVKIEQNPAWSEEDEEMLASFLHKLEVCTLLTNKEYQWADKKLKSLKERYIWKPSKKQIIALRWVLNNVPYNKHKEEISGLLDQIKDL